MNRNITKTQYEEIMDAATFDTSEYSKLLKKYTGIVAKPCTSFLYYDDEGSYLGDTELYCVDELLAVAGVVVK